MVRYLGKRPTQRRVRRAPRRKKSTSAVPLYGGGMPYYTSPVVYQRGRGLGGVLVKLFRQVVPFLKRNPKLTGRLKRIGRGVASAGLSAAQSTLQKENSQTFKKALKESMKEEAKKLMHEVVGNSIKEQNKPRNQNSRSDIFS